MFYNATIICEAQNGDQFDSIVLEGRNYCPCVDDATTTDYYTNHYHDDTTDTDTITWQRFLQTINSNGTIEAEENDTGAGAETWEVVVTCLVLVIMFACLISDIAGADSIMLTALTIFMVTSIVSIPEGLEGFANEGVLTVLVLFVVAEGISRTGALDWYMGKLLGRPSSVGSAQVRLMVPIAFVSAFLNNTPVVAVMIPIVQKWGKNIRVSQQQLLIPLSYASILGGTCTLIGTSTNLIVEGLLKDRYPDNDEMAIGLFDLGEYGVPIAMMGIIYVLIASPFLLPGSNKSRQANGSNPLEDNEDVLLGARMTQWSPAAGRSVKRSGLRDTGGIYLVSVHRSATGNVHRAVGQEFVLNVGDILYFTGLVEEFGAFCEEHGLEILTNEVEHTINDPIIPKTNNGTALVTLPEDKSMSDIPVEIGTTRESVVNADYAERMREITRLTDMIRGIKRNESMDLAGARPMPSEDPLLQGPKVVVTIEEYLVIVGVDSRDRPGLLLDLSKGLLSLNLQMHYTEASVVDGRSLSIWRCEPLGTEIADVEKIWNVMTALLEVNSGILAQKKRGLKVIRSRVTSVSRLLGRTAAQINFRQTYKAAIVAVQRGGKNVSQPLSSVSFEAGDILILQASEDSPLLRLTPPTADFYRKLEEESAATLNPTKATSMRSLTSLLPNLSKRPSSNELKKSNLTSLDQNDKGKILKKASKPFSEEDAKDNAPSGAEEDYFVPSYGKLEEDAFNGVSTEEGFNGIYQNAMLQEANDLILKDLEVILESAGGNSKPSREFLTAMTVVKNSQFIGQTPAQAGILKLAGVVLISIERPKPVEETRRPLKLSIARQSDADSAGVPEKNDGTALSVRTTEPQFTTIELEEKLLEGDVLWFAGSASAVGDLRKIPGLRAYESEEVGKLKENVHDRRLVQAVIARKGPLVGKTVKEVRFRTRYGAAVIAVHREGKRIHDHPGSIVLQAGDVLLLEAGNTFIGKSAENERSFALLSEVKDSAPPRLRLLLPALLITGLMLAFATWQIVSLLVCALIASICMVLCGILSEQEARDAVNWEVFVTIGCAFGIGTALENSGVANAVADGLVWVGESIGIGDAGLYGAVYLATVVISNIVTNNAAAALVFPIALDAAEQTGADPILMSYTLMLGASASFMTPFGYTTNLMIYGPGGYKSLDFLAFGTPLQIILWIFTTLLLASPFQWWLSWGATFAAFVVVVGIKARSSKVHKD